MKAVDVAKYVIGAYLWKPISEYAPLAQLVRAASF